MPELPEVETIVRRLQPLVVGSTIEQVEVRKEKSFQGSLDAVVGATMLSVERRAKFIRLQLDNNYNLLVHLKMTGQLIYVSSTTRVGGGHPTADWVDELPSKHTRVIISLSKSAQLFFNDQRIFGWIKVMSDDEVRFIFDQLGPDVIDASVTPDYLYEKLQGRSIAIKQAIMDNSVMSGLGNIYACDALNRAKIHPARPAKSLSKPEVAELLSQSKQVLELGIKLGGATIEHFMHIDGFSGRYQDVTAVYGREGDACYNCGGTISKIKLGGRGTYLCEGCQE